MATLASLMITLGIDPTGAKSGATQVERSLDGLGDAAQQTESRFEGMVDGLKTAGKAAGVAAGAALTAGFVNNLSIEAGRAKLAAQLNLSAADARKAGSIAGSVYRDGWGESLDQVNQAVRGVVANMNVAVGDVDLQPLTRQATILSDVFGIDVVESTRGAGQMMRNLGTDGQTAMDLITRVMQTGGDRAEDLLDTLTEYSPKFADLGLSGEKAMGLINQGLSAGARNTDLIADAFKEFAIRAIDGSKLTAEGFQAVGLDAEQMAAKIAAGGPAAAGALDMTLDRLRAIEDPVKRDAAAVALFGTQAEDLGDSLYALDPSEAVAQLGNFAGATKRAGDVASDTGQNKIEVLKRQLSGLVTQAAALPGPLGAGAAAIAAFGPGALSTLAPLGMMISSQRAASAAAVASGAAQKASLISTTAQWARSGAAALLHGGKVAAAWLLVGGINATTAVVGTVAAAGKVVAQWVRMGAAATLRGGIVAGAWLLTAGVNATTAVASTAAASAKIVAQWVRMGAVAMARAAMMAAAWLVALGPIGWAIAAVALVAAAVILNWDKVSAWTKKAWTAVTGFLSRAWDWIVSKTAGAGRAVVNFVRNAWQSAKDWAIRKATELVNWVRGLPGRITSALGNLGSLLVGAGRSIIQGLWNGIQAMGSWLKNKILGFIRSFVPGPVLRFLGIGSPSRLFAGIGRWIPEGLAQGIAGNTTSVVRAAERMAAATVPDMPRIPASGLQAGGGRDLADRLAAAVADALSAIPLTVLSRLEVDGVTLARAAEQGQLELRSRR